MGSHALRGAVSAWLTLIVLQAVSTKGGSGRVAGLFTDLDNLVKRALDPGVPAIRDRRTGGSSSQGSSPYYVPDPAAVARGAQTAGILAQPSTQAAIANGLPGQIASLDPQALAGLSSWSQYTPEQLAQAWGVG